MKTKILLLLLSVLCSLTIPLHAQEDVFHPFLQDGKTWEFDRYSYNEDLESVKIGKRTEYISGDTVIIFLPPLTKHRLSAAFLFH